jgi:leucyl aminopeptidase
MLTAGIFLGEFVGQDIPWSHIDIAGPSYNEKAPRHYDQKGGTGFGVRTLLGLAESYL